MKHRDEFIIQQEDFSSNKCGSQIDCDDRVSGMIIVIRSALSSILMFDIRHEVKSCSA